MPKEDSEARKSQPSIEESEEADEKTAKKLAKLSEKTAKKLAKLGALSNSYEDYVNVAVPKPSGKRTAKQEMSKGGNLLRNFEESVFDWENEATKRPAFDAFKNVFESFDRLRSTFDARQKEIVDKTDYGKNMAMMVGLMRQQIEGSERTARSQSRRFYISLAIAAISVTIAVIRIVFF